MLLNCEDVIKSVSSDQLLKTGWRHRLAVRLHLLMCRNCRRYQEQIRAIGSAARQTLGSVPSEDEALERIKDKILTIR